jgi:beta-glucanase (GH16 family)
MRWKHCNIVPAIQRNDKMSNSIFFAYAYAIILFVLLNGVATAFSQDPYSPDRRPPTRLPGMKLTWSDEFNRNGKPNPKNWKYESGFVRNQELQWYQAHNANCINGVLVIEARREAIPNPGYNDSSDNWKSNRQSAAYTSSSINTKGLREFTYGRFEIRARIDTSSGSWPAIWTLGTKGGWPLNGEVDIMEFYRVQNVPTILANLAWGRSEKGGPVWNTKTIPLSDFIAKDPEWTKKFHVWRMDWSKDSINLYLDNELLNTGLLHTTLNPDSTSPFREPHYLLLNLAVGSNGGDPSNTTFPIRYEVDYVRYYSKN